MDLSSKIYVAGHKGMVGSALWRCLESRGYKHLIGKTHQELDLTVQKAVDGFFNSERPEYVFLAAAEVGGIFANMSRGADFIYRNLAIQINVLHYAWKYGVTRLLFLGSSCIYPRECPQPIKEEYLLTGLLERTNEPYAIAKIAGIKMCDAYNRQYGTAFFSAMPTNLYGPFDNFDPEMSHVLPALIRRFVEAREERQPIVKVWGTGRVRREFLHVDDAAEACIFLMSLETPFTPSCWDSGARETLSHLQLINIGAGKDISIAELAYLVKQIVGYEGDITFDRTMPDGTPRKLLDVSRIHALGWKSKIPLEDGIRQTVEWYLHHRH